MEATKQNKIHIVKAFQKLEQLFQLNSQKAQTQNMNLVSGTDFIPFPISENNHQQMQFHY